MKNITFSAQEKTIEQARQIAAQQHRTLNDLFREWLQELSKQQTSQNAEKRLQALWQKTDYLRIGKKLSREEMNER